MLNASWFPIGIQNIRLCLIKVCNNRASIISPVEYDGVNTYQEFSFEEWLDLKPRPGHEVIRTKKLVLESPEIVKVHYDKLHIQKLPLRAPHVFARDGHKCWYCGSEERLTVDHILAQCKGGKTSWKNVIACCQQCNNAKGDMDVVKFCEIKKCKVPRPVNVGSLPWLKQLGKNYPDSWKKWLNFNEAE